MKVLKIVIAVLVLLLVAGYFGVPYLLETSWAREKVRKSLAEKTGRDVEVGEIAFGWTSGLTVSSVTVKQKPGDYQEAGPLFQLDELHLSVGLSDILDKTIHVDELTVDEPKIVIVRDRNGRFNFSDLLAKPSEAPAPGPEPAPAPGGGEEGGGKGGAGAKVTARLDIRGGTILYIDEPLGTRVEAKGIDAEGHWNDGKLSLDLTCDLNGGKVKLLADSDLSAKPAPFTVKEFTIDGAEFGTNLAALGLFLPLAGESPQEASGTLAFSLQDLTGRGFDLEALRKTLSANGKIRLKGGALVSGPVTQLYSALQGLGAGDLSALAAGATGGGGEKKLGVQLLTSNFRIEDGKIRTDDMKLDGAGISLTLSGWTSLDGHIDYKVLADGLDDLLAKNEKLAQYLGEDGKLPLGFTGTLSNPKFTVDVESAAKKAIEGEIEKRIGDKIPGGIKLPIPGGGK